MKMWITYFKTMMSSKKGQGMVEYGLIIGVVAVMLIAGLVAMREQLATLFGKVADGIANGGSATPGT